ncbi:MAG: hypothetical protein BTN85_1182 [Candidatus Methanohalarchaeum thermophilum]|uniref:Uncharacterized protein n=1 Tax=Methanohalarchaeum thermophilum TaxID=1903181 RepID=A0A1Q6DWD9_METT1|nr:MAG: hypothetical protein BTN85_1182 [Candidatus Methanohalarchaeum thermophilum]
MFLEFEVAVVKSDCEPVVRRNEDSIDSFIYMLIGAVIEGCRMG